MHAPGARSAARAALPELADAIFADTPTVLTAELGRRAAPQQVTELQIIDAFGPNPSHPLESEFVLSFLIARLAANRVVRVKQFTPAAGGTPTPMMSKNRDVVAGAYTMEVKPTSRPVQASTSPNYLSKLRLLLGSALTVQSFGSLDQLRSSAGR